MALCSGGDDFLLMCLCRFTYPRRSIASISFELTLFIAQECSICLLLMSLTDGTFFFTDYCCYLTASLFRCTPPTLEEWMTGHERSILYLEFNTFKQLDFVLIVWILTK